MLLQINGEDATGLNAAACKELFKRSPTVDPYLFEFVVELKDTTQVRCRVQGCVRQDLFFHSC